MKDETVFLNIENSWRNYLIGQDLDLNDKFIKSYVEKLNSDANEHWNKLNKSDIQNRELLWDDLKIKKYNDQSCSRNEYNKARIEFDQVWYCFMRLNTISKAIMTNGCELYKDKTAIDEVLSCYDVLCEDYFSVKAEPYGNWYDWEIGIPQSFLQGLIILSDYISEDRMAKYLAPLNKYVSSCTNSTVMKSKPKMTGANLLDKATSQAMIGVLEKNGQKIDDVLKAVKTVFTYANNTNKKITQQNDGFWRDGSYIQHAGIAYNGGYGAVLYSQIGIFLSVFNGTPWQFSYDDKCENIVYNSVFLGLEPLLYNARFMDMTSGRGVSRIGANDRLRCVEILSAIIPYVDSMPSEDMANRLKSLIKYHISFDEDYFYDNCKDIYSLTKAKSIMADDSVEAKANCNFNKCFASMDKTVHTRKHYSFAISMHSNRTYCHEIFNREGKTTWNISDGMTYLYDSDNMQYSDGFWGSVDMRRLSGTTSEYVVRPEGAGHFKKNPYKFVGMTSLDSFGVSAMHLRTLGNKSLKNGTKAKKSWFMFDDEIVCLGSDISSRTGNFVETIIDNRKIDKDALDEVVINGEVRDDLVVSKNSTEPKGKIINDVSYIHLSGEKGSQIGYVFPKKSRIKALKEIRKTNWLTIGNSDKEVVNSYATFLFDHGKRPKKDSYAYAVLPEFSNEQTNEYAQNQNYEIIAQNSKAHIVKHKKLNVTGACLWKKTSNYIDKFKASQPLVAMAKDDEDCLQISLAEPTQSKKQVIFSYNASAKEVLSKDKEIEILSLSPIKVKVNTFESYGKTFSMKFKK